jgi:tetratricopeptide (TPR) repeat protein
MLQEDYIIRMVRLAVAALAQIFDLKQLGNYQQAQDLIAVTLIQLTGMDDRLLNSLDIESLLAVLSNRQGLDYDRVIIVADLLKENGEIYTALNLPDEARPSYLRALFLYLEAALGPLEYPPDEMSSRIDTTLAALNTSPLPVESLYPLWFYFEKTGKYDRAIQVLDEIFRQAGPDPDLKTQGIAFYQRMAKLNDHTLESCHISRNAISQKIKALKAKTLPPELC